MVPSTVIIETYSICSQCRAHRSHAKASPINSLLLLLLLTPGRSKGFNNHLPVLVRYTSLSQSHFSSLNVKFSYAKKKQAGLWSKQELEICSLFSFAVQLKISGRFPVTKTDYVISIFYIKHCTSMFCITKIHILVLVSTMNICIPIATIYKFYDHEEEKKKGYLLRQLKNMLTYSSY